MHKYPAALLNNADQLTHRVHILEANGESYRLKQSRRRMKQPVKAEPPGSAERSVVE